MSEASLPLFVVVPPDCLSLSSALDAWPSLLASYSYQGDATAANLRIDLALDASAYTPSASGTVARPANVATDLALYMKTQSQLALCYDERGVTDLAGYVFDLQLTETLFGSSPTSLSDADAAKVRAFVAACVDYLRHVASEATSVAAPQLRLELPRVPSAAIDDDIVPLVVALTMRCRPLVYGLPSLRVDGPSVTIDIPVATDAPGSSEITAFASAFETIFSGADSGRQIGIKGSAPPHLPSSVWAIRIAKAAGGKGINFTLADEGGYFAAKPIARTLLSATVGLPAYSPVDGISSTVTTTAYDGIDLNVWTRSTLASIDSFLNPDYLRAIQAVVAEPAIDGVFTRIQADRHALTEAIATTVAPILCTSSSDADTIAAARESLLDATALASETSTATTVGVFVAHSAAWTAAAVSSEHAPRFHGRIIYGVADEGRDVVSMGAAVVTLAGNAGGNTRVAFAFRPQSINTASEVAQVLRFEATSVECAVDGALREDAERTVRIAFVTSAVVRTVANGATVHVPIPLRETPAPPASRGNDAAPVERGFDNQGRLFPRSASTPAEFPQWCCRIPCIGSLAAQDAICVSINAGGPPTEVPGNASQSLFEGVARFNHLYPQIVEALDRALSVEEEGAQPTDENVQIAGTAVKAFESILRQFVTAYAGESAQALTLNNSAATTGITFDVRLRASTELTSSSGAAAAQIDLLSIAPSLPIPGDTWVEFGDDTTPLRLAASPSFAYVRTSGRGEYVPFDELSSAPFRVINLQGLDACAVQSVRSGMHVKRNTYLVPGVATTAAFCFDSAMVQSPYAVSPALGYDAFPLALLGDGSLAELLGRFFGQLLAGAVTTQVSVTVECAFSGEIAPGIHTLTPILLLPRTVASASKQEFIAPMCDTVRRWSEIAQPGSGSYEFKVSVFADGAGDDAAPLMSVEHVFIDSGAIAF